MILYQDFEEEEKQLLDTKLAAKTNFILELKKQISSIYFSEPLIKKTTQICDKFIINENCKCIFKQYHSSKRRILHW